MAVFLSRKIRNTRPEHRYRSFRPRIESLEDRTVLSTLTVRNNLDSGAQSLRDAIMSAKSGDTIVFAASLVGQAITLTSGALAINKDLDIEGPGASLLAVSGNDTSRVFDIGTGNTITIAGLTITHGRTESGLGGGGILNVGSSLTLRNALLSYNTAHNLVAQGGAISNAGGGTLNAIDTTFAGNQAAARPATAAGLGLGFGGAIANSNFYNTRPSTAVISGCTFNNNQARGGDGGVLPPGWFNGGEAAGGAIFNETGGVLSVHNSTFTNNQAVAGSGGSGGKYAGSYIVDIAGGGAIFHFGSALTIDQSSFTDNRAIGGSNATASTAGQGNIGSAFGGAIASFFAATITDSAFDRNEAIGGSGNPTGPTVVTVAQAMGGAISQWGDFGAPAPLTASGLTITNNRAIGGHNTTGADGGDGLGGGIAIIGGATLGIIGSTMSGNSALGGDGGAGGNGGNGFGGGLYIDASSVLTVASSAITTNHATGGAAGTGGSDGLGVGGGAYFAAGSTVFLDLFTQSHLKKNRATTSNDNIFGDFTFWP